MGIVTPKLPDHPGDLIRLAVLDLVAAASQPERYEINMGNWHAGGYPGQYPCEVCFAGAVMAKSLKQPFEDTVWPDSFNNDTEYKLGALNAFRCGEVSKAYSRLRREMPLGLATHVVVEEWKKDRDLFLADMLDLAQRIDEAEGMV